MIPDIKIEDFNYDLPEERIARYPLERRDMSKLLVYKDGEIRESVFRNLLEFLDQGSLMVFNDTKVVPARLFFKRDTGAHIEIFCLEPHTPAEYNVNFAAVGRCSWKCVIGNAKKWKGDIIHLDTVDAELAAIDLCATLVSRDAQTGVVEFTWKGDAPFSKVLDLCGRVPIPPYLNRDTEAIDLERYQTMYAHIRGSVAAPTAGLHFTQGILDAINAKGIELQNVCLHVGAGTFLPVKSSLVAEHSMHRETVVLTLDFFRSLCRHLSAGGRKLVAVGTTSVRTLESLYYIGVNCIEKGRPEDVDQWAPYEREYPYSTLEAISAIVDYLEKNGLSKLETGTRIIIVPGFRFRLVDRMVTNFHQPQSTLLLLISAFVGGDWQKIYNYALNNNFRFLSYGDSSLLFRAE